MATIPRAQSITLPLLPAAAAAGGLLIALIVLVTPTGLLEGLVGASGVPAVVAAAEPPLGMTARLAMGLLLGGGFACFAWVGLSLLAERPLDLTRATALLRRGDVHPDGPPRPPLFAARELGTPFLEVKAAVESPMPADVFADTPPAEQALPADFDQPIAAFDRCAMLADPLPAAPSVSPLRAVSPIAAPRPALIDPGDRIETFELTPVERPTRPSLRVPEPVVPTAPAAAAEPATPRWVMPAVPEPVVAAETEATVHDLLARLERRIAVPEAEPASPTGSIADTLGDLRRMAIGAR